MKCFFCNLFLGIFWGKGAVLGFHTYMVFELQRCFTRNLFLLFFGGKRDHGSACRNCSQGKLKLIYLMMLLQTAMIVKSLPKYMYMYCSALSSLTFVYQLKCFGMQSPRTKEYMAVSSVTRINDYLDSPVSFIPSGLYTNTSHT